jgi:broad specificity phosphatase PhoE
VTPSVWLIRHGETEWSRSGQHTGRTDIAMTAEGERQAATLAARLAAQTFALALSSPLTRARETARIAGYGGVAEITDDLREWDYGAYEGRSTADIRRDRPGWSVWTGGVPGGETVDEVGVRLQRVIERARGAGGDVVLFGHAHALRILGARWLDLPPVHGRYFRLDPASISILGYERETPVIVQWNAT